MQKVEYESQGEWKKQKGKQARYMSICLSVYLNCKSIFEIFEGKKMMMTKRKRK